MLAKLSRQSGAIVPPALRQISIEVAKVGGLNLGQGVCQLPVPSYVLEQANAAAREGVNRYTNPRGLESLRLALAKKLSWYNGIDNLDPDRDIVVTCGATGAFEGLCATLLDPGDEVVVFEPSYPYHVQALRRYGVDAKFVALHAPDWSLDIEEFKAALSPKTKFVLVCTPGNPSGKVFSVQELGALADAYNGLIVTDETYEHMAFDIPHVSAASLPALAGRVVTIGSYSKTFSITGWRIGYCLAPPALADALTSAVDAIYACAPAPLQEAVARGIDHFGPEFYKLLNDKYRGKRDRFADGLQKIGLEPKRPQGAYYMLCGYDKVMPGLSSAEFANKMIMRTGVGAVPSSDFVRQADKAPWVRFCLALEDDVLEDAMTRLGSLV
ncbi:MAG: pyridoxal phosphate-dependent aminotransferase [Chthonomonadaceae bacterium]|nr:pyridoxal phosphate-dependent aminotransferase [Chthonomonadaceae bacterium]